MWPFLRREEIKVLGTVLKRLAQGIFVTFCVIFISFVILRMIPGDPAKVMAPTATVEQTVWDWKSPSRSSLKCTW